MVEKTVKVELKRTHKGTYLPFNEIHLLYMPYEIHWICPGCNEKKIVDLEQVPFEYPKFNKPIDFTLYCEECDVKNRKCEYQIKLKLNLKYKLDLEQVL